MWEAIAHPKDRVAFTMHRITRSLIRVALKRIFNTSPVSPTRMLLNKGFPGLDLAS